jgi:AraC family transcriptional regulator of adaptative response/methylated-DNA-[protein]-cysteine methyltransferase
MTTATRATTIDDERWRAVTQRDRGADGTFYYAERTTDFYSRPSCVVCPALREQVLVFSTAPEAEAAGFRPCRRCRPDQPTLHERHTEAVMRACRVIDATPEALSLDDLADASGFSRFHFHRVFKAMTGLTPYSYITACRSQRMRAELSQAGSVTDAIYNAGFNSNGRFYATSPEILGMMPASFRSGGEGMRIHHHVAPCSMGSVLVAAADRGVCAVLLGEDTNTLVRRLRDWFPNAQLSVAGQAFTGLVNLTLSRAEPPLAGRGLPDDVRAAVLCQRIRAGLRDLPAEAESGLITPREHAG